MPPQTTNELTEEAQGKDTGRGQGAPKAKGSTLPAGEPEVPNLGARGTGGSLKTRLNRPSGGKGGGGAKLEVYASHAKTNHF